MKHKVTTNSNLITTYIHRDLNVCKACNAHMEFITGSSYYIVPNVRRNGTWESKLWSVHRSIRSRWQILRSWRHATSQDHQILLKVDTFCHSFALMLCSHALLSRILALSHFHSFHAKLHQGTASTSWRKKCGDLQGKKRQTLTSNCSKEHDKDWKTSSKTSNKLSNRTHDSHDKRFHHTSDSTCTQSICRHPASWCGALCFSSHLPQQSSLFHLKFRKFRAFQNSFQYNLAMHHFLQLGLPIELFNRQIFYTQSVVFQCNLQKKITSFEERLS